LLCRCFRLAIANQRPNDDTAVVMQDSYDADLHTNCLMSLGLKSFTALQRKLQSLGMSLQVVGRIVRDVSKDRNGFIFVELQHRYQNLDTPQFFRTLSARLTLSLLISYIYMELLVKSEI
jgi:hypothetical protein